ncbi:MAG: 30S ribosomal protein S17e [Candidatus Freyarchaeota archaeon]
MRPYHIKRIARKLVERHPNVFTADFDENKELVRRYTNVESKRVRNRIAGYIVGIVKRSQVEYVAPEEEEFEGYVEYEPAAEAKAEEGEEEEVTEEEGEEAEEEAGEAES